MSDLIATPAVSQEIPETGLSGLHIVPCSIGCYYPPQVEGEDLLEVDFDQKSLRHDGLYLVETIKGGKDKWRGCRRFQVMTSGWWIDQSGEQEWMQIESVESLGFRVVGCVREVYKPAKRIDEIIGRAISAAARNLTHREVSHGYQ